MNVVKRGERERTPTRTSRAVFAAKIALLRVRRGASDRLRRVPRHARVEDRDGRILGSVRLPLWGDLAPEERLYELGKIQNLRAAARRLDGLAIPAEATFSFWRQVGRCTRRKGFVTGRQIAQGCFVPSVGGGLCLLSNALYAAAREAGLEVLERHPHTRAVPGSLAERGEDATVAWNHIDLRFRSPSAWRLEVRVETRELLVTIRGDGTLRRPLIRWEGVRPVPILDPARNACGRCARKECARYEAPRSVEGRSATLALSLAPEFAPEFAPDPSHEPRSGPRTLILDAGRASLPLSLRWAAWRARLAGRQAWRREGTRAAAEIARAAVWGEALARWLPYDVTHLRVDGRLLATLENAGALGGRAYDVLTLRPPLETLHRLLNDAAAARPEQRLLSDFRAPEALVRADREAYARARSVVTPHVAVARTVGRAAERVEWATPEARPWTPGGWIVFPGPTHARKGAYEVREAARRLGLPVRTLGNELEGEGFWRGIECARGDADDAFEGVLALVQPAWVEERPAWVLAALASGIPVVATPECGVAPRAGLTLVPPGDALALEAALKRLREGGCVPPEAGADNQI